MTEKVIIGNATLYHGDCREVLPGLPKFDLVLTDPPYGIGAGSGIGGDNKAVRKDYGPDTWDEAPPPSWLIELIRVQSRWQVMFGGNYFSLPPTSCWLVWDKDNTGNFADCELAWTNLPTAVRRIRWRWNGMLQQDMANKEEREHPTQKPVPVMRWALLQAKDVATVCDPFMGSGTTGVACVMEGKSFTGIERERKYFDIACERISRAQAQGQLIPHEAPVQTQEALL